MITIEGAQAVGRGDEVGSGALLLYRDGTGYVARPAVSGVEGAGAGWGGWLETLPAGTDKRQTTDAPRVVWATTEG